MYVHSLHQSLQNYLGRLEACLDESCTSLNINKSAVLVFPSTAPVRISLQYYQETIPKLQVDSVKYLGVIYYGKLVWRTHIEHITTKAELVSLAQSPLLWTTQGYFTYDI